MSRYIDAGEIDSNYRALKIARYGNIESEMSVRECLELTLLAIDMCNTADVVSREQYNACYDELLKLRSENERLIGDVYWQEVTEIANRQRKKGIKTYGHGLEDNTSDVFGRLDYIEEELVDALVYLRHLRRALAQTGDDGK